MKPCGRVSVTASVVLLRWSGTEHVVPAEEYTQPSSKTTSSQLFDQAIHLLYPPLEATAHLKDLHQELLNVSNTVK